MASGKSQTQHSKTTSTCLGFGETGAQAFRLLMPICVNWPLTGFMSNRGRQNVASFLAHDLKVNWQLGAEYFESTLIDYDTASNWGNWNYIAGVGNDPREDHYFNILNQARRYDPEGEYIKRWLPELSHLPADKIHRPDTLSVEEQEKFQLVSGKGFPKAMIDTDRWV